ncbi:glycosyltransferase [Proteus mirabilis]|uniref:glycosyltransferase n=1 Tax=Proteus mirabilis TaxID=584 RepID=UPI003523AACE
MKRLNIIVHSFDKSNIGGVTRVISDIANLLVDNTLHVRIISLGKVNTPAFYIKDNIELLSLNMKNYDTRSYKGVMKIFWFINSFLYLTKIKSKEKYKCEIWYSTSPPLVYLLPLLKRKGDILIGCTHTSNTYKKNIPFFYELNSFLLKKYEKIIALTIQDLNSYKKIGVSTKLIPNGIDLSNSLNHFTSMEHSNKNIIFVGRLSPEKDPIEALNIFYKSKLFKQGFKLIYYGNGSLEFELKNKIINLQLTQFVKIIKDEINIDNIYKNAYALILTSKIEGFGMVLIEAISKGVPCVAYDCPNGPRNIIQNGLNGYLIPINNRELFIDSLIKIKNIKKDLNFINSIKKFDLVSIKKSYQSLLLELSENGK